jgi:hypothetical protein
MMRFNVNERVSFKICDVFITYMLSRFHILKHIFQSLDFEQYV